MTCSRTAPGHRADLNPVVDPKPRHPLETRELLVESIAPLPRAWAPMSMSCVPHGMRRRTRNCLKCVAAFAENGNTSSLAVNCSTV